MSGLRSRLVFLDRLRGLAVLVMIEVHVTNALLASAFRSGPVFRGLDFVNGLVAPAFLFCAGYAAGAVQHPLARDARRSIVLLVLGYLLHISGAFRHDWPSVWQADILQVIAVALGVASLVNHLVRGRAAIAFAILAVLFVLVTPAVRAIDTTAWPAPVRPYFTDAVPSQFPLFPWAAFALGGAACAGLAPKRLVWVGVAAVALGALDGAFLRFGLVAGGAWLLSLIDSRPLGQLDSLLSLFGRRSLLVYFAHIIVVYGTHPFSLRSLVGPVLGPAACALVWVAVTAAMGALAARAPRVKLY